MDSAGRRKMGKDQMRKRIGDSGSCSGSGSGSGGDDSAGRRERGKNQKLRRIDGIIGSGSGRDDSDIRRLVSKKASEVVWKKQECRSDWNQKLRRIGGSSCDDSAIRRLISREASEVEWKRQACQSQWDPDPMMVYNVPPLFSDEVGIVDTSHACFVYVDGSTLKERSPCSYEIHLEFAAMCYLKRALYLFTHPGQNGIPGGLASSELVEGNELYLRFANKAITQYNLLCKANLRLVKLLKVNSLFWTGGLYYMTFLAYDEHLDKTGTYRAALKSVPLIQNEDLPNSKVVGQEFVLGLFIDCSTDMILACILNIGAEEDLAAAINKYGVDIDAKVLKKTWQQQLISMK